MVRVFISVLFLFFLNACEFRPLTPVLVGGPSAVVIDRPPPIIMQEPAPGVSGSPPPPPATSPIDIMLGEIVYTGLASGVPTEADVFVDGRHVFILPAGAWAAFRVSALGEHTFLVHVYLKRGVHRGEYLGCVRGRFFVEPTSHTSQIYGHWWRVEIPPPFRQC